MKVKCPRDNTVFNVKVAHIIECPTCNRKYLFKIDSIKWESDKILEVNQEEMKNALKETSVWDFLVNNLYSF